MDEMRIANKIKSIGGKLYLVGGAVRDELMGIYPQDKDYCVTGISKEDIIKSFPEAKIVGKDFPVYIIDGCEVALARKEHKIANGYKGFEVETSKEINIVEDLKRRDITINAIAKDILTEEIIDPFGGIQDIKNKIIISVSSAFKEDPLRVYRVARFAAKLDFTVEKDTIYMMKSLKNEMKYITSERVYEELKKALQTDKPSIFFNILKQADVLDVHFKEVYDLIGVVQPQKYHPEGDVYAHTMIVLDSVSKNTPDVSVRFAALVHDLGKAKTPKEILPQHIGHDEAGVELVVNMCNRLKLPTLWKKRGVEVSKYHMKAGIYTGMRPYKKAKFLNMLNRTSIGIKNMEYIVDADDMLKRPKISMSNTASIIFSRVNGKSMIDKGISVEKVGKDEFLNKLYEEQAKIIKEIE